MFVYTIDDIVAGIIIVLIASLWLFAWFYDNVNKILNKLKSKLKRDK